MFCLAHTIFGAQEKEKGEKERKNEMKEGRQGGSKEGNIDNTCYQIIILLILVDILLKICR